MPVPAWGYADERLEEGYGYYPPSSMYRYDDGDVRQTLSNLHPLPSSHGGKSTLPRSRAPANPHPQPMGSLQMQRGMENWPIKPALKNPNRVVEKEVTVTFRPARGTTTKDKSCRTRSSGIREYTILQTSRLGTIMDEYCHAMKCRPSETKFVLRKSEQTSPEYYLKSQKKNTRPKIIRTRLREDDTPLNLRLEDGDEVIVCARENGMGNSLVLQIVLILIGAVATSYSRR